ncbi:Gfo/Idh/MocA family protein [Bacillus toyonensis]|uniref:Gfo/Idh/MocA family protein n=1 Tax=Bacillus toyonensis TaxID=155322 RepID=UPI0011AA1FFC|nr:Gfo/Idh/MocA family oxidoreductase [Bacillus toyonensis]
MKVLIIGMGFSGQMFLEAFHNISHLYNNDIDIAYTSRSQKDINLVYYPTIESALELFKPDILVISVNDENHGEVLFSIQNFNGFVICEKPFVDPNFKLENAEKLLKYTSGFCLNMVARYSQAARLLKAYVNENNLKLVRANFLWEKNRINDYRPTTGVISEIIHSLDLVQWINGNSPLKLRHIQGVKSDYSISGDEISDSVSVMGEINGAVVTGYSSFVNLFRRRELDFVFQDASNQLIFAQLSYDTPNWYEDSVKIWTETSTQSEELLYFNSLEHEYDGDRKIERIINVVKDVTDFVMLEKEPSFGFPNLKDAVRLQELLNEIDSKKSSFYTVKYNSSEKRVLLNENSGFGRLG